MDGTLPEFSPECICLGRVMSLFCSSKAECRRDAQQRGTFFCSVCVSLMLPVQSPGSRQLLWAALLYPTLTDNRRVPRAQETTCNSLNALGDPGMFTPVDEGWTFGQKAQGDTTVEGEGDQEHQMSEDAAWPAFADGLITPFTSRPVHDDPEPPSTKEEGPSTITSDPAAPKQCKCKADGNGGCNFHYTCTGKALPPHEYCGACVSTDGWLERLA